MLDDSMSERRPGAWTEIDYARGKAGLFQSFEKLRGDGRRIARRLEYDSVAADNRRYGHAAQNRQGKIPRGDHRARAQRDVMQQILLPRKLHHRLGLSQVQSRAGVQLTEVDGLAGVG